MLLHTVLLSALAASATATSFSHPLLPRALVARQENKDDLAWTPPEHCTNQCKTFTEVAKACLPDDTTPECLKTACAPEKVPLLKDCLQCGGINATGIEAMFEEECKNVDLTTGKLTNTTDNAGNNTDNAGNNTNNNANNTNNNANDTNNNANNTNNNANNTNNNANNTNNNDTKNETNTEGNPNTNEPKSAAMTTAAASLGFVALSAVIALL